jgi:hypothetical protein
MGLASEQDAKLVAEMVARYPEVKSELEAIEICMEEFDRRNAVKPPAQLKEKIMASVSGSEFTVSEPRNGRNEAKVVPIVPVQQSNFYKYAAAVALILLLSTAAFSYYKLSESSERIASLEQQMNDNAQDQEKLRQNLVASDSMLAEMTGRVALLSAPGMKSIELKGMPEVAPDAKAMVYANSTNGDSYLEILNLPAAPEGMQYQFWGIVDGKPVDAGMIPLEGDLAGIHPMGNVPNAGAYAISLEVKGGVPQPQGKIYVLGTP